MNYKVFPTSGFKKEFKRLLKKYPSLKSELENLNEVLQETPEFGTKIKENLYKIRLAIKSKGKGKRGGARVITYLLLQKSEIYLLTIYDKSEIEVISEKELDKLIGSVSLD